jgi:hypothetical protein
MQQWKETVISVGPTLTLQLGAVREELDWEFAANTHLLKLQRLQNKVLRTTDNFPRCTPVRELHKAFNIPYIYDYISQLYRQQAKVIQNHENANVRHIGQGKARHRKHKRLKLGDGQAYDRSSI